jgi:hypothetical protein
VKIQERGVVISSAHKSGINNPLFIDFRIANPEELHLIADED